MTKSQQKYNFFLFLKQFYTFGPFFTYNFNLF